MHVVESTQRWPLLFQPLVTVEQPATVLEHILVPSDSLAGAPGPWAQGAECWEQAGRRCHTSPAMLQLPPPAGERWVRKEGCVEMFCELALGRTGSPPAHAVAHFAPGSAAWAGVPLLHLGGDLAAEGEFDPALEEPVWVWALWPGKSFSHFPPTPLLLLFRTKQKRGGKKFVDAHGFLSCQSNLDCLNSVSLMVRDIRSLSFSKGKTEGRGEHV